MRKCFGHEIPLISVLATSNLGSRDSAHLGDPLWSRLHLANGTDLIAGVAGNADIVASLKGELDVADLEDLASSLLCIAAGGFKDLIDEVICYIHDGLVVVVSFTRKNKE